jgi:hypothetical protein
VNEACLKRWTGLETILLAYKWDSCGRRDLLNLRCPSPPFPVVPSRPSPAHAGPGRVRYGTNCILAEVKQLSGCRAATCPQLAPFLYSRQPQGLESPAPNILTLSVDSHPLPPSTCLSIRCRIIPTHPLVHYIQCHCCCCYYCSLSALPPSYRPPSSKNILPR